MAGRAADAGANPRVPLSAPAKRRDPRGGQRPQQAIGAAVLPVCPGEAIAHEHFLHIESADLAGRNGAAIPARVHRRADRLAARHQLSEPRCGSPCAVPCAAARALAELVSFGGVDPMQSDPGCRRFRRCRRRARAPCRGSQVRLWSAVPQAVGSPAPSRTLGCHASASAGPSTPAFCCRATSLPPPQHPRGILARMKKVRPTMRNVLISLLIARAFSHRRTVWSPRPSPNERQHPRGRIRRSPPLSAATAACD
jgi:hypothetical protein